MLRIVALGIDYGAGMSKLVPCTRRTVLALAYLLGPTVVACDGSGPKTTPAAQDAGADAGPSDRCENPRSYFYDADGDGYGNLIDELRTCVKPNGYVNHPTDCNDRNSLAYPMAEELCDGVDNDCNDVIDDGENIECASDTYFPCETGCGTQGVRYCSKECKASECTVPMEVCNYKDDDCDGVVDERTAALSVESVSLSTRLDHLLPDGAREWIAVSGDSIQSLDFFGRTMDGAVSLGLGQKIAAAQVIGETVVLAWQSQSKVGDTCTGSSLLAQAFRKSNWAPVMSAQTLITDDACRPLTAQMVSLGEELLFVVAVRDATAETTELSTVVSSPEGVARVSSPLTTLEGADVSDAFKLVATPATPSLAALVFLDPNGSADASIKLATFTGDGTLAAPTETLDTGDVSPPVLAYDGESTLLIAYAKARELGLRSVSLASSGGIGELYPLLKGDNVPVPTIAFRGGRWFVGAIADFCAQDMPTCSGGPSLHVRVLGADLADEGIVTTPIAVLQGSQHHLTVNTATALFVVGNESVNYAYLWACPVPASTP